MEDTIQNGRHVDEIIVNLYYYSFIVFVSYIMWSVVQGLIVSSVQDTETKNKVSNEQLLELLENLNSQMQKIGKETAELKEEIKGM